MDITKSIANIFVLNKDVKILSGSGIKLINRILKANAVSPKLNKCQ